MNSILLIYLNYLKRLINGKELTNKDGVQIEKDVANNKYTLVIPKVNPTAHSGVIIIKAVNPIGAAQHEISLNILGMPLIKTNQNKIFEFFF